MPGSGAYSYIKLLLVGRPTSLHPALLTATTIAILGAAALILWLAPWPVDALIAVGAAMAWTSWLDRREPE